MGDLVGEKLKNFLEREEQSTVVWDTIKFWVALWVHGEKGF